MYLMKANRFFEMLFAQRMSSVAQKTTKNICLNSVLTFKNFYQFFVLAYKFPLRKHTKTKYNYEIISHLRHFIFEKYPFDNYSAGT